MWVSDSIQPQMNSEMCKIIQAKTQKLNIMKTLCHVPTKKKKKLQEENKCSIFLTGFTIQHIFSYDPNG